MCKLELTKKMEKTNSVLKLKTGISGCCNGGISCEDTFDKLINCMYNYAEVYEYV